MATTLNEIIARAEALRKESYVNSIDPERVGSIMSDTLKYLNEFQLQSGSMGLDKIYASVSAMNADTSPMSDLTGKPLKAGQLAVIVASGDEDEDNGKVYRFDNPGWTYVSIIGNLNIVQETGNSETAVMSQKAVTDYLNAGYLYKGIATPETDPGTPDQNVFYLATQEGTYTNFGGIKVSTGEAVVFKNTTSGWEKSEISLVTKQELSITSNEFCDSLFKELYIEFIDSQYTIEDVAYVYYIHASENTVVLGFYNSGHVRLFGATTVVTYNDGDIYDLTEDGVRVRAVLNLKGKELTSTRIFYPVVLNKKVNIIAAMPIIFSNVAIAENTDMAVAISASALYVEGRHSLTDDIFSTTGTGSNVYAVRVREGDVVNFQHKIFLNTGHTSYSFLVTNNDKWGAGNILMKGQEYTGAIIKTVTENITIPAGGKWLYFISRDDSSIIIEIRHRITDEIAHTARELIDKAGSRTIIYVGKNMSKVGGYETLQEAINSISDASIVNQYELRLTSDEIVDDVSKLWLVASPLSHAPVNPSSACAVVITKDYVNITGYNRRRKVAIYAPDTTADNSLQYIQALYLQGNVCVDNVDFEVRNGRYAIHQESGGSQDSPDFNAITVLRNSNVRHLGNFDGATWTSCYAQANGACGGLRLEYHNVLWTPAFYTHQNANFDSRNIYIFDRCVIQEPLHGEFQGVKLESYIGMNGSSQNSDVVFTGSCLGKMRFSIGMMPGNTLDDGARDIRSMIPNWSGYGNALMRIHAEDFSGYCLTFKTVDNGKDVDVVSGSAKALIFGDTLYKWSGTENLYGLIIGTEFIGVRDNDYAYTLAHRLGNCATSPKTLVLSIDGEQHTITFAENYVTSDGSDYTINTPPIRSDEEIRQFINSQLSSVGIQSIQYEGTRIGFPMQDASEFGMNYNSYAIPAGAVLVRDTSSVNGWKYCPLDRNPEGVAMTRINPNECGLIASVSKNLFRWLKGLSWTVDYTPGQKLYVTDNGSVNTSGTTPVFEAIDENTWKYIG